MSHSQSQTSLSSVDGGPALSRKKSKDRKDSKSNASNNKKNTKKRITKDDIGKPENFQWADLWIVNLPFNLLTPISDQDRISPYNVNAISGRQVMRIKKNIN